jgi:hypothetical protein
MRKITLLLALVLFGKILLAQENFQPGYIIDNNGNKIEGYIDYQKWAQNPVKIRFKKNLDSSSEIYFPGSISSFYVHDEMSFYIKDEMYVSATVDIDMTPQDVKELTSESKGIIETKTVFLALYLKGKYNLYHYRDINNKVHYFIKANDDEIKELIYRTYLKEKENKSVIIYNEHYKKTLKYYFKDDPTIIKYVDRLDYTDKQLVKILTIYSENMGVTTRRFFQNAQKKAKLELNLLAGFYNSSIKVKDNKSSNLGYTFGLGLNLSSPRELNRFSWNQELNYFKEKVEYDYREYEYVNLYYDYYADLKFSYIKYNSMINYRLGISEIKPYINLGLSFSFLVSSKGDKTKTTIYNSEVTREDERLARINMGLFGGFGINYKRFNGEIRYEMSGSSSLYSSNNIYLILSYNVVSVKN